MTTVFGHPRDLPASVFVKAESPFRDRGNLNAAYNPNHPCSTLLHAAEQPAPIQTAMAPSWARMAAT
jgi:hypothetical protein